MKVLVFDIGGTAIKYGSCTDGKLSETKEVPTNAALGGRHIMNTVRSLISQEESYAAIGISTAGQVNAETGSIIYANSNIPDYTGMQLRKELEEEFHVPVMVENDVNSAAMGEAAYGAGQGFDSFLCLTYGTGVGGAIVQNKAIYHGSSFSAGEFGGIVTHGSINTAGSDVFDGCYERFASTTALVRAAQEYNEILINGRRIFEHIDHPDVKRLVDDWINEILLGLVSIIHIFNPSCIVLGGGVMVQPYVTESIRQRLGSKIMPSFSHVKIVPAQLGNLAGLLGIYYLTLQYIEASAKS